MTPTELEAHRHESPALAAEIDRLAAELRDAGEREGRLREALEPFAGVIEWIGECTEKDRNARFPSVGFTLHIDTGASGFGYTLEQKDFENAHDALEQPKRAT